MRRKFVVWLSIFLSLSLPVLGACGTGRDGSTITAAEQPTTTIATETISAQFVERDSAPTFRITDEDIWMAAVAVEREKAPPRASRSKPRSVAPQAVQKPKRAPTQPRPAPKAVEAAPAASGDRFSLLADCETGARRKDGSVIPGTKRNLNTGNGYYGFFQFLASTWRSLGYTGLPHEHPYSVQAEAAQKLQARSGWSQWPDCRRRLGF